jgi:RNA methyltransferase, TrmH family
MITSKENSRVKHAKLVREGRVRDEIFVEGLRLCEEVFKAKIDVVDVLFTADILETERGKSLLANFNDASEVSDKLFATISDTKNPQGICIIAKRPKTGLSAENNLVVVLHQLNNPSNVGAILRTCEAAGVSGVILTKGTADAFSAKTLRGSMGASLRLPLLEKVNFEEVINFCREQNLKTVCADIRAEKSYTEIDWTIPHALIVGSEANGLTEHERNMCNESLKIPMYEPVESLNVAVACGVVLFEAKKVILNV